MAALDWETGADGQTVLVRLSGDLDISTAARLEPELKRIEPEEPPRIVLDVREAGFVDSTGLSLILNADARARKAGRRLQIVMSHGGAVERIFRTIGLYDRLDIAEEPPADV